MSAPTARVRLDPALRLRLGVLAGGNFAVGTGAFVIVGVLPAVARDVGVGVGTAGQLMTVYALTYAVAAPLLVSVLGRFRRRTVLLAALAVFLAGNVLALLAPGFALLAAGRLVSAVGGAMYTPTSLAAAASLAAEAQRGRALALAFSGLPVATVLGVPLGTVVGEALGWRWSFGLVVALAAAGAVAVAAAVRRIEDPPLFPLRAWRALLARRGLVPAVAVTWLQATAQFTVITYLAALLAGEVGLGGTAIAALLLVNGVAGVAGTALGGSVADRWPAGPTLAASIVLLAAALATFGVVADPVTAAVALVVWGVAGWGFNPVQQQRLVRLHPPSAGATLALNASVLYLGSATGAVLGAAVLPVAGLPGVGPTGAVMAMIALAVLAWGRRPNG
ncbi:MAG TPA: MFS transporter [Pseudonocardia sp.]|nr:MFS transporter [Pseudonocardia sp.]